jgi:hypothetical protein
MIRTYCTRTKKFKSLGEGWGLLENEYDNIVNVWYFYYRYSSLFPHLYCKGVVAS